MIHLMTSISHLLYLRGREKPAGEEGQRAEQEAQGLMRPLLIRELDT